MADESEIETVYNAACELLESTEIQGRENYGGDKSLSFEWIWRTHKALVSSSDTQSATVRTLKAWQKITLHTEPETPLCEAAWQEKKDVNIALSVREAET